MPARPRAAKAQSPANGRTTTAIGDPPSSAGRQLPLAADEVAGPDEAFIQLADGDAWPAHFGAQRFAET